MGKQRSWSDQQLADAVKQSQSYRNVLIKLNLVPADGNYVQIQKRIATLELPVKHFTGQRWNKGIRYHTNSRPLIDELLTLNSGAQSYKLKNRLYEMGLQQPMCELCAWDTMSTDGRIPVELDHINGNHKDNRLENLRILCPNCHSLQITHRGKNKGTRLRG